MLTNHCPINLFRSKLVFINGDYITLIRHNKLFWWISFMSIKYNSYFLLVSDMGSSLTKKFTILRICLNNLIQSSNMLHLCNNFDQLSFNNPAINLCVFKCNADALNLTLHLPVGKMQILSNAFDRLSYKSNRLWHRLATFNQEE